jgi:hypothetical protein
MIHSAKDASQRDGSALEPSQTRPGGRSRTSKTSSIFWFAGALGMAAFLDLLGAPSLLQGRSDLFVGFVGVFGLAIGLRSLAPNLLVAAPMIMLFIGLTSCQLGHRFVIAFSMPCFVATLILSLIAVRKRQLGATALLILALVSPPGYLWLAGGPFWLKAFLATSLSLRKLDLSPRSRHPAVVGAMIDAGWTSTWMASSGIGLSPLKGLGGELEELSLASVTSPLKSLNMKIKEELIQYAWSRLGFQDELRRLSSLKKLKKLDLSHNLIESGELACLTRLDALETLVLREIPLDKAEFEQLARLPNLRKLELDLGMLKHIAETAKNKASDHPDSTVVTDLVFRSLPRLETVVLHTRAGAFESHRALGTNSPAAPVTR